MTEQATTNDRHAWEQPGAFEVAADVHRIPLPLPGDGLKAVNVYALTGGTELTLVDAGWALAGARERLDAGLHELGLELGDVRRVLVTHVHRDHYELAVHLRRDVGSHVALGHGERASLEAVSDPDVPEFAGIDAHLRWCGAAVLLDELRRIREGALASGERSVDWQLPDSWLHHDQVVDLGDRRLRVVATPGHTAGHVVFVDEAAGLLFAGDHILPHITPSVGFEGIPPRSALRDYLGSLLRVRALPDHPMLPAHGPVRPTTHDRIDVLLEHHDQRLAATAAAVGPDGATAAGVAAQLPWTRRERHFDELDAFNRMLAVNETAAHLQVLVDREALGVRDEDGVAIYRP